MAEPKKNRQFEAETPLIVKVKPVQKAVRQPILHEGGTVSLETADATHGNRKQVILRIIDFLKTN